MVGGMNILLSFLKTGYLRKDYEQRAVGGTVKIVIR